MREVAGDIRFQLSAGQFVYLPCRTRSQNCATYFAVIDNPPRVRPFLANFRGNKILRPACRAFAMNSCDRDVLTVNASRHSGMIVRFDDPWIFVGGADEQTRELEIR